MTQLPEGIETPAPINGNQLVRRVLYTAVGLLAAGALAKTALVGLPKWAAPSGKIADQTASSVETGAVQLQTVTSEGETLVLSQEDTPKKENPTKDSGKPPTKKPEAKPQETGSIMLN